LKCNNIEKIHLYTNIDTYLCSVTIYLEIWDKSIYEIINGFQTFCWEPTCTFRFVSSPFSPTFSNHRVTYIYRNPSVKRKLGFHMNKIHIHTHIHMFVCIQHWLLPFLFVLLRLDCMYICMYNVCMFTISCLW